jgi:hypothetical protein
MLAPVRLTPPAGEATAALEEEEDDDGGVLVMLLLLLVDATIRVSLKLSRVLLLGALALLSASEYAVDDDAADFGCCFLGCRGRRR